MPKPYSLCIIYGLSNLFAELVVRLWLDKLLTSDVRMDMFHIRQVGHEGVEAINGFVSERVVFFAIFSIFSAVVCGITDPEG